MLPDDWPEMGIADGDGKNLRRLKMHYGRGGSQRWAWSPDSSTLAILMALAWQDDRPARLWTFSIETLEGKLLTSLPQSFSLVWAKDLLVIRKRDGSNQYGLWGSGDIWGYDPNNGNGVQLTHSPDRYSRLIGVNPDGWVLAVRITRPDFWESLTQGLGFFGRSQVAAELVWLRITKH
jgi:Tol biopolymer transport system component